MAGRTTITSLASLLSLSYLSTTKAIPLGLEPRSANLTIRDQQPAPAPQAVDMFDQLKSSLPFVQFELADSKDQPFKPFVIDLQDCGTLGLDKVKTIRAMRRIDKMGQNAVRQCQTFLLQPMLHESPNRFGIHTSDTSSIFGIAAQDGQALKLIQTDPLFFEDQRFQIECTKPSDADKDRYLGMNCTIKGKGDKCLFVKGYKPAAESQSLKDEYEIDRGDCTQDDKEKRWNIVKKSKCFTPDNHLIVKKAGDKPADPPQGC